MQALGRLLLVAGGFFLILGVLFLALGKLGLPRLPGDIVLRQESFTFYFPIVTCLVLSLLLSLILWLLRR